MTFLVSERDGAKYLLLVRECYFKKAVEKNKKGVCVCVRERQRGYVKQKKRRDA